MERFYDIICYFFLIFFIKLLNKGKILMSMVGWSMAKRKREKVMNSKQGKERRTRVGI